MNDFPFAYERIAGTTWAYLSSLLMLALFFKFNRFWSFRNFDLVLIILLAPGILMIDYGKRLEDRGASASGRWANQSNNAELASAIEGVPDSNSDAARTNTPPGNGVAGRAGSTDGELESQHQRPSQTIAQINSARRVDSGRHIQLWGFYWLFAVGAVFLIRMLLDPLLVRRPLLAPNLTIGGLVFLACSLMIFLFANIITSKPAPDDLSGARSAVKMVQREAAEESETEQLQRRGPGHTLFLLFPVLPTFGNSDALLQTDADRPQNVVRYEAAAKSLAIVGQLAIIVGLVVAGSYLLNDFRAGVGMATIYLMLPYTAQYTGHVLHILPAALLLWAIICFRRPGLAGIFVGLAIGVSYYPLFLLFLWISFYWERGWGRFAIGVATALVVCIAGLVFTSADVWDFFNQLQRMFAFWAPIMEGLEGIWGLGWDQWFRLPIFVAFVALCISFVFWPAEKNLGTLISYTAAVMIGVQFWHGFDGGLFMAWYIPLALLAFFRPNMNGRIAQSELRDWAWQRRRSEVTEDLLPAA